MRMTNYKVAFAFTSEDSTVIGLCGKEVTMNRDAVELMLRALAPFQSDEWVSNLNSLRRNVPMFIRTREVTQIGNIMKLYKITRI